MSLDTLSDKATLIPKINLKMIKNVIGNDTVSAVRSGFFWGYAGLIDNIVNLIKKEKRKSFKLVITGGFSDLFKNSIKTKLIHNKDITITLTGTDVEGDNITFQIVDNPVNVNAAIDGTTLTINKSSSFWGADSLTYYAYDGTSYGETAKVDITFKRYINYSRSSYDLKHTELYLDAQQCLY